VACRNDAVSFSLPLKEKHVFRMRFVVQVTAHNLEFVTKIASLFNLSIIMIFCATISNSFCSWTSALARS
jgi:hypothetical protein